MNIVTSLFTCIVFVPASTTSSSGGRKLVHTRVCVYGTLVPLFETTIRRKKKKLGRKKRNNQSANNVVRCELITGNCLNLHG
ncbi:hypothetical protein F4808DRAFT_369235 [Astrocystis sublimbata]|nr:hypothetical protein F4808DRAFT_369235 [Astrocystis sublimbata]